MIPAYLNLFWDLIIGVVAGAISGFLVSYLINKREKKREIYSYWNHFLFEAMERCDIWIPAERLEKISAIGPKGSRWYETIFSILEYIDPSCHEDRTYSAEETEFLKNVGIALEELNKWKNKNHL